MATTIIFLSVLYIWITLANFAGNQTRISFMNKPNEIPFKIVLDNRMIEVLSERSKVLTHEQALIDLVGRCVSVPTTVSKNDRSFTLNPGEAEVSFLTLAREWQWDRKTVRKFLNSLQETGCLSLRHYPYGTVASFPTLITSPPQMENSCPSPSLQQSPSSCEACADTMSGVPVSQKMSEPVVSVLYDDAPLVLDGETRLSLRKVYDIFRSKLPHLDVPEFNLRTEKAIYYVFILGMNGDMSLMERFLDLVASDENMNGEMAELTGNLNDRESFESLFSPRWLEILFPARQ